MKKAAISLMKGQPFFLCSIKKMISILDPVCICCFGGVAMRSRFKPFGICLCCVGLTIILITVLPGSALWFILGAILILLGLSLMNRC